MTTRMIAAKIDTPTQGGIRTNLPPGALPSRQLGLVEMSEEVDHLVEPLLTEVLKRRHDAGTGQRRRRAGHAQGG
jgi:hypothetical protein